jgi:outer membrane immunogenic protein
MLGIKMKLAATSFLTAVAAIATVGSASAADMAVKAARPMIAPIAVYNWTGFYIGGNAGYSWRDDNVTSYTLGGVAIVLPPVSRSQSLNGFIGGGQVGYNWQSGQFVLGVEGDAAWRDAKSSTSFAFLNAPLNDVTTFSSRENWFATLRPRAGIAVNNFLLYVTGGAAFEGVEHTVLESRTSVPGGARSYSTDDTRVGWTVGAGVEAGFGPWSVGLEYLFADFGNRSLSAAGQTVAGVAFPASAVTFDDSQQHIVRAKLNYRFGGPVVAKY